MSFDKQRHIDEINAQGYSIAEGIIDADFADEIINEIKRLESISPPEIAPGEFVGYDTIRYFDLLNRAQIWERVAVHPPVIDVIRGVLGSDALLSTMGTAVLNPGETQQRIHCDDQLYGIKRPHKNLVCNTMWALSDFSLENGATRLVPRSNKFDHYPDDHLTPEQRQKADGLGSDQNFETIQAVMPRGSICFIVGTTYHGAATNHSSNRRWALTINYCAGSQRQQENLMLAHTYDKLLSFPSELQRLIGLRISNFGVGHINVGDPKQRIEAAVSSA